MIELDKRIISGKKPLTCFDAEQARNFVGEKCYLTNDISLFRDLDKFKDIGICKSVPNEYDGIINTLSDIDTEISMVFETTYLRWKFCIPCEWVKQKLKYRPYTKDEFLDKFECGKPVNIRHKDDHINVFIETMSSVRIDNYMDNVYVRLYERVFDLEELFDEFEWQKSNGEWHPFGVEE